MSISLVGHKRDKLHGGVSGYVATVLFIHFFYHSLHLVGRMQKASFYRKILQSREVKRATQKVKIGGEGYIERRDVTGLFSL